MTDFKQAMLNAFRSVFPSVSRSGCFYHFSQCIYRQVQQHGLQNDYARLEFSAWQFAWSSCWAWSVWRDLKTHLFEWHRVSFSALAVFSRNALYKSTFYLLTYNIQHGGWCQSPPQFFKFLNLKIASFGAFWCVFKIYIPIFWGLPLSRQCDIAWRFAALLRATRHVNCNSYHANASTKYLYGRKYAAYNKQF